MSLVGRFCKYKGKVYEVIRSAFDDDVYLLKDGVEAFEVSEEDIEKNLLPKYKELLGLKCKGFRFKDFDCVRYIDDMYQFEGVEGVISYHPDFRKIRLSFDEGDRLFTYPLLGVYKQLYEKDGNANRID